MQDGHNKYDNAIHDGAVVTEDFDL